MPQPGAPIPTGFIYIEVPPTLLRQPSPQFGTFASIQPYTDIEHYFKGRCVGAELKDLISRTRVYRLPNTALIQFPEDPCNAGEYYLPVGNVRIPVLLTDPTVGKAAKSWDWIPVG
jgi:hypothetical protein